MGSMTEISYFLNCCIPFTLLFYEHLSSIAVLLKKRRTPPYAVRFTNTAYDKEAVASPDSRSKNECG